MKKPLLFKIPSSEKESFRVQYEDQPYFYDPLHFHPELQLTYILESNGTFFIGDNIKNFKAGDILLIGANLTHVFRNDKLYYEDSNEEVRAKAISVFFTETSFGADFFELPEAAKIKDLIKKSGRGLKITGETRDLIAPLLETLKDLEGFFRIIKMLEILNLIAENLESDVEYLSSLSYSKFLKESDSKKINDVFEYVMQNFSENIKLSDVADIANMSVTSFCRYFKLRTRKTFSLFLNEIRVGHACKLLKENKYNISEICYECGFNNISNFNRQFKAITNYTPTEYKKKFNY
ncbi:AraC family transcriptional regulator [Aureibacter tunicatorum]|uniref:AraC-like DNA-binding protein n=1 Tax=Aureibacter tunicatorum TaxID=866807 RepID=A0AAE3XJZ8_9BACT|nr:AraC family transcriptional regulator [Aureibacter tunicatorum]MDR6237817.1 AraC-like DNA-binding protein [Aureibacter tunicatorum]BDD02852.1 AraC family transcriptional regulator [Aureibacter tunicatorum]